MKKFRAFVERLKVGFRLLKQPYHDYDDNIPKPQSLSKRKFFLMIQALNLFFISMIIAIFLVTFIGVVTTGRSVTLENFEDIVSKDYDTISSIGCGSDSMGLTLGCHDLVYEKKVTSKDDLRLGRIYTYSSGNHSIIHRLVACVDTDCNLTVFKGDNNALAEFVNFSNITYKVVRVEYK